MSRLAVVGLTHPFRGGISHYTTLLCRALSARHDVRFYALSRQYPSLLFPGKTQIDESDTRLHVEHEACLDSINPWTWLTTGRKIARFRPELAIFSWWHPFFAPAFGTVARVARWSGRVPSCFICHNVLPHERSLVDTALLRYVYSPVSSFITHSQQDHDDLVRLRPDAIVHRNPHPTYDVFAAEDAPSADAARRKLGLEGRRVLLFFGFIREYKGLDVLLEAMRELPASEGYHLIVVGEFYEARERYEKHLERLQASGQITLVDRYVPNEEVPLYFAASDLVMVPYLTATQSGVIQIAYGFGKPVVATNVGGIPEVVVDGKTGRLVPPGNSGAIADAVKEVFAGGSPERFAASIAEENEKYSWDRMVETLERILDREVP